MPVLLDGRGQCDTCGLIKPNGSIVDFLIVNELNQGMVEVLLFCRENKHDKALLTKKTMAHYLEEHDGVSTNGSGPDAADPAVPDPSVAADGGEPGSEGDPRPARRGTARTRKSGGGSTTR